MDKRSLRQTLRSQRRQLTPTDLAHAGEAVLAHLVAHPLFAKARTIALYAAARGEVPLDALLDRTDHRWVLPRVVPDSRQLTWHEVHALPPTSGRFAIREPAPEAPLVARQDIDLWLIPAVAVDVQGMRLGQGGGYYDTVLADVEAPKVAVIHDFQLVERVPTEAHDRPVDHVLTPLGWRSFA